MQLVPSFLSVTPFKIFFAPTNTFSDVAGISRKSFVLSSYSTFDTDLPYCYRLRASFFCCIATSMLNGVRRSLLQSVT
jgi:hypothetical protein